MQGPSTQAAAATAEHTAVAAACEGWADALAHARIVNHASRDVVDELKKQVQGLFDSCQGEAVDKVAPHLAGGADAETVVAGIFECVQDALLQVSTRDAELKRVRAHKAYVKPKRRYLGARKGENGEVLEEFYAYDGGLKAQLEAMFATRPDIWAQVEDFVTRVSTRMRTTTTYDAHAKVDDLIDGAEFGRFYKRLKVKPGETPLVFILYYDGLEVVNGLGQARLTHELACFYWALVNIPGQGRMQPHNVRLATVCLKRAIPVVGMDVVINGRPEDGDSNTSWGASMMELGSGFVLPTPSGERTFRGGTTLTAADTPAGAELFGVKKAVGPSTKSVCKCCHCLQHGDPPPYRQPNSFLCTCEGWKRPCAGRQQRFVLRSTEDLKEYVKKLFALKSGEISARELGDWKVEMGINDFLSAMRSCPYLSLTAGCPMDMMHVLLEGTCRNLLGIIAYVMIRRWGVDQDDLVSAIADYARKTHAPRSRYPFINSSRIERLREGTDFGRAKSDADFPGTAMQIKAVALDAPKIWGNLVSAQQKTTVEWKILGYCSKIVQIATQASFSHDDMAELDKCIWLHDLIWLGSPEFQHAWKPKNHYLSHLPYEILLWGPLTGYWCEPFEHENQYTKGSVSHSNYANALLSAADGKALLVALETMEGKHHV